MRLLLVEDSARLRDLLDERVRGAGWQLDALGTMEAALEATRSVTYDLVLVDLGLPDGDGKELIRVMRARGSAVPILVLTARGSIDDRVTALDCGADDYLVEAFQPRRVPGAMPRTAPAERSASLGTDRVRPFGLRSGLGFRARRGRGRAERRRASAPSWSSCCDTPTGSCPRNGSRSHFQPSARRSRPMRWSSPSPGCAGGSSRSTRA